MAYLPSGSPFSPIQQAMFFILDKDPTLRNQVNGIFDFVPNNYPYPYVQIGEFTSSSYLTFTNYGEEVIATVHVFCRNQEIPGGPQGSRQAQEIMYSINRLLAAKIFPIGEEWADVGCWLDSTHVLLEPDGITWHGILKYRIVATNRNSVFGVSGF
jgi:hypothetical protein